MQPTQKKKEAYDFTGENFVQITEDKTEQNNCEIVCGACGKIFYADKETANYFNRLIEQDLDNFFLCDDCQKDYEENVVEDR